MSGWTFFVSIKSIKLVLKRRGKVIAVLRKISYLRWNEEPVDINVDKSTLKSKYFEFTILEFLTFMIYTQLKHIIHISQSMCYFLW